MIDAINFCKKCNTIYWSIVGHKCTDKLNGFIVTINIDDLKGKGFGGFVKDSTKDKNPKILIDINCILNCCVENEEIKFKNFFSESVLRKLLHMIEELFDK